MTRAQADSLMLVARVASASDPGHAYEVKTDGGSLSCNCPGWTRQVHTADCRALRGQKCSCRHSIEPKTRRTCRHLRETATKVHDAGGLQAVIRLIQRGVTLSDSDAAHLPPVPTATNSLRSVLVEEAGRVIAHGPTRVIVDAQGLGVSPISARTRYGIVPSVVFIRDDGWSCGAPTQFVQTARALYPDKWVGVLAVPTSDPNSVVAYTTWTGAGLASGARPRPAPAAPMPPAANDLSWIGGGRAILLMD